MTYLAGLGFGPNPRPPTLECNGCHIRTEVRPTRGGMPAWLRNQKAPKGWKRVAQPGDAPAHHYCPRCIGEGIPW